MQLEDYFEFEKFDTDQGPIDRIRVKGHRIAIEHILEPYRLGASPEYIVRGMYPSLSLEEVYAVILYYLRNRQAVEEYEERGRKHAEAVYQEHLKKPVPPVVERLRALKSQMDQEQTVP